MPVGATLTALRRERGKTAADVEGATKIMGRMISALENERWDELPAQVYVRGYIQNYAQYLGVDPAPLLEEYSRDLGARDLGARDLSQRSLGARAEHAPLRSIPGRTVVPHRLDVHAIPRQAWIAVVVAVLVVVLVVWGVSALLTRGETPPPIAPETTSTVGADAGTTGDVGSAVTAPVTGGAFILKVEVIQGQSSWLQVRVDGLIAYEGTLPGGESKMWTVTDNAVVRVGKPDAVTLTRDGQAVAIPPANGGIAEVDLSAGAQ